ncbi:MAG: myo-inosose-2 dehydratase [Gammaproteobacteria bacterium]|nr:myo-inosose-2 dehydratase [Gammaproteobacteria bacterium]MBV9619527.1 myo-inosose-2 dehydratase [Gammaproteobacteria bacterium]
MGIHIGANPILWSNDDLRELGADISLETCLSQAHDIGFEGMELGHKFPREAAELSAVLSRYGLKCISGWYSARLRERDANAELRHLRAHLDLLKALGSSLLICAEVSGAIHSARSEPLARRPRLGAGGWRGFGQRLSELARMTAQEGVQLAYHHHMGTVVQSESDIDALMEASGPEVGLLLDTGHARFAGADPLRIARSHASRIRHLHAKDVRAEVCEQAAAGDWSFLQAVLAGVFTVPGDGCIDFASVFRALHGYSGWIVLEAEQDPERADPLTYATRGYATLRRLIAEELR